MNRNVKTRKCWRMAAMALLFPLLSIAMAEAKSWEAFGDPDFKNGLMLSPLSPGQVAQRGGWPKAALSILRFTDSTEAPSWHLCQWHTHHSLQGAERQVQDGNVSYSNIAKSVVRDKDGTLRLEVNARYEYDHPRKQGEMWPHLLVEQDFVRHPNVGRSSKLKFRMSIRLEKEENHMAPGEFNVGLHSAQCPFYMVVRNVNKKSKDYNQFIWFGILGYDYRNHEMRATEIISWDVASKTYIYVTPQRSIWGDILFQDKRWHNVKADLRPYIVEALLKMKEKGFFGDTTLDDLELTGMNFGWEVPGTFNAAVSVKNFSLKVTDRK